MRVSFVRNQALTSGKKFVDTNGFLVNMDVPITRGGAHTYKGHEFGKSGKAANDDIHVWRPIETYTPELLEQFANTVVTNDHPTKMLSPDNVRRHDIGTLGDRIYLNGNDVIAEKVIVRDGKAIKDIEDGGKKEVSIGFEAEYDFSGIEVDGVQYDAIENILSINHLSLVDEGKAGPSYRLNNKPGGVSTMIQVAHNGEVLEMDEKAACAFAMLNGKVEAYESMSKRNADEDDKEVVKNADEDDTDKDSMKNAVAALSAQVNEIATNLKNMGTLESWGDDKGKMDTTNADEDDKDEDDKEMKNEDEPGDKTSKEEAEDMKSTKSNKNATAKEVASSMLFSINSVQSDAPSLEQLANEAVQS
jgi:hypothetical protein